MCIYSCDFRVYIADLIPEKHGQNGPGHLRGIRWNSFLHAVCERALQAFGAAIPGDFTKGWQEGKAPDLGNFCEIHHKFSGD